MIIDKFNVCSILNLMSPEHKGQYYFSPDSKGDFKIQKTPLGQRDSKNRLTEHFRQLFKSRETRESRYNLGDFTRVPEWVDNGNMAYILHDLLLADLSDKGITEIIARETQTDSLFWFDYTKENYGFPANREPKPNPWVWEVDVFGPNHQMWVNPNSPSCWTHGTRQDFHDYSTPLEILVAKGWPGEAQSVSLVYKANRELTITGKTESTLNLNDAEQINLARTHLRDAMENPLQSIPSYSDGRILDVA